MTEIKKNLTPKPNQGKFTTDQLKYMRDKDREMVKGIFRYFEVPGGVMEFSFKKYKGDPVENYTMYDGETYTIPRGVALHLNKNGAYPEYENIKGEDAKTIARVKKMVHRFAFQSLEFVDLEEPTPIYSVEMAK